MAKRKLTDAETWDAIREGKAKDDLEEIAAMSPEEVDDELRQGGIDPDAVRARGLAQIAKLRARHVRLGWQMAANQKVDRVRATAKDFEGRYAKLPRKALEARVQAARSDARFGGQVSAMFRNRTEEESSDDDLRKILEEFDLLATVQGDAEKKKSP